MSTDPDPPAAGYDLHRLNNHINEIKPLLELDGEWRMADADVDPDAARVTLRLLQRHGAIVSETEYDSASGHHRNKYRWKPAAKQHFRAYAADMATLPCGCREHVPPDLSRDAEVAHCKHCGQAHDADALREWLS